jgi:hypothetical protein
MLFGAVPFAAAPFADPGGVSVFVSLSGNRINIDTGTVGISASARILPNGSEVEITIGNVTIRVNKNVLVSGAQINLATNTLDVITWNPIPPGVSQIWIPIDPDNP